MRKIKAFYIFLIQSVLDGKITDNLPIGLFGDFYNHELTFILLNKNDLKNIKQIFNKNSLNIKKIINKSFIEGANLIDENRNNETFYYVKINKKSASVSFFESSAFRYYEKFNFGTNILKQDISKVCSVGHEMIDNVLANKILSKENFKNDDLLKIISFKMTITEK